MNTNRMDQNEMINLINLTGIVFNGLDHATSLSKFDHIVMGLNVNVNDVANLTDIADDVIVPTTGLSISDQFNSTHADQILPKP